MAVADRVLESFVDDMESRYSSPPRFDISLILPLLFTFLIEILGKCLEDSSPESVQSHIAEGDIYTRIAARKAVRAAERETKRLKGRERRELEHNVIDACRACPPDEMSELIAEVRNQNLSYEI